MVGPGFQQHKLITTKQWSYSLRRMAPLFYDNQENRGVVVTTPTKENGRTVYETVGLHNNIRYTIATYDYGSTRYFLSQASVTTRHYDTMEELLTE